MADSPAMAAQRKQLQSTFGAAVQLLAPEEELQKKAGPEEELQMKAPEEELQMKPVQRKTAQLEAAPNRTGMPDQLKSGIENLSGMDMSDVRVHTNSSEPRQLNALAYAQGSDIHLGPGQEKHMPHEAWHVVQQRQGRVQPTTEVGGVSVNDNPGLESEADAMGSKALAQAKSDDELEG
ncbi:MAG: DUF4157 domain-containing protein [Ramlibacter sp.]|nr:DUF4157 domain-containing protein [Ramlibacter sp.]